MADYKGLLKALETGGHDASEVVDFTGVHAISSPLEEYKFRLFLDESLTSWVDIEKAVFPEGVDGDDASSGQVTIWANRDAKVQFGQLTRADVAAASFLAPLVSWEYDFADEFVIPEAQLNPSGRTTCRPLGQRRPPSGRGGCFIPGIGRPSGRSTCP